MAYTLKMLEAYGYFSMSVILVLYLSSEFGLTDIEAGAIYGMYGALTSVAGFMIGFLVDNLGVRLSLILGFSILTVARLLMALTSSLLMVKFVLFFLLPIGSALGIPVLSMGIKRYTTPKSRGFAFGLFYAIMNIAALVSGLMVDILDINLRDGAMINGMHYSSKRLLLLSGAFTTILGLFISFFFREIKVDENGDGKLALAQPYQVKGGSPLTIIRELVKLPFFWKFMGITIICINLKMIFRYLDAVLPTYLVREFGSDVPKGSIYAINPALIIILVPLVSAWTSDWQPFGMIHIGSYVSGISALPLALNTSIPSAILFVVILSLGEAVWSPRFYDLTVSMAPEGREGTFVALGSAPLFMAKFPVGLLSGHLLQTYCPEEGPRDSRTMWTIICVMTMSSPILLTLFQRWLRPENTVTHGPGGKDV